MKQNMKISKFLEGYSLQYESEKELNYIWDSRIPNRKRRDVLVY